MKIFTFAPIKIYILTDFDQNAKFFFFPFSKRVFCGIIIIEDYMFVYSDLK